MPVHPSFPRDPYTVVPAELRWYPGAEELDLDEAARLMPPLVANIRVQVHEWRQNGYLGASETSRALLDYWFGTQHLVPRLGGTLGEFRYYFAQREAVETAIWLYEVERARDPYSLMRYDATEHLSKAMFPENWTRYVFKLATGAGKTKVLSLLIAWSYFHKLYEADSAMSTNALLIAPNIIVLDRLRDDFDGLRIFSADPVLPPNGLAGRNWADDFQLTVHLQDEVAAASASGNLFLTNIHRLFESGPPPHIDNDDVTDYFLGRKPVAKSAQGLLDVGDVVRDLSDLLVLNDEAHHIHEEGLAWFRAIEGIDQRLRQRNGRGIAAQFDVTATPKDANGAIFVQTVCSYPLVEAIRQGVVKTPVVPDEVSRSKLHEHSSDKIEERYADHIKLGYLEWAKRRDDLEAAGKKPILFVMTTTTAESDQVAAYLERTFPDLEGRVLTIHTNRSGEISEGGAKGSGALEALRRASRAIDSDENPYLAVVSVLMLREGWDVQNVVSMVGLRPFTSKSQVLPEQTLGRGLRRMFREDPDLVEYVSVVGTEAFLDFVEGIRSEGVELEKVPMGGRHEPRKPLLVEVDTNDKSKHLDELDIPIPMLTSRVEARTKNLDEIDAALLPRRELAVKGFTEEQQREIVFRDLDTDAISHTTDLGQAVPVTPQAVLARLTTELMRRLRLVGGQDVLFGKVKVYVRDFLFENPVELEDPNVLRNLSEPEVRRTIFDVFAHAVRELVIFDARSTVAVSEMSLPLTRPVVVNNQPFVTSSKTVFNRVVGDSKLELLFAKFLDGAKDVTAFAKNSRSVHFSIEYVTAGGEISNYFPDFLVRTKPDEVWVVETKGLEDVDVAPKWNRLKTWCLDATRLDPRRRTFSALYVPEDDFKELVEGGVVTFERLAGALAQIEPHGVPITAPDSLS